MAFAQLLLHGILLPEPVCVALERVSEDKAGFVENGDFVAFAQLASLVPSNQRVVDKGSVARQVLEYGDSITAFLLSEEQAMSVRNSGRAKDLVLHMVREASLRMHRWRLTALPVTADQISTCWNAALLLLLLVLFFLALELALAYMLFAVGLRNQRTGNRACLSTAQDHYITAAAVHGHQVPPHLLAFLILDSVRPAFGRVDELRKGLRVGRRWRGEPATDGLAGRTVGRRALGALFGFLRRLSSRFLVSDGRRQRALLQATSGGRRRQAGPLWVCFLALRQLSRSQC